MKALYTIGYEGTTLEDFLSTLRRTGITLLLDIREIPLSRRKGFSKSALKQAVEVLKTEDQHEKHFGSPKNMRDQLHINQNYDAFFADFNNLRVTQLRF